MVVHVAHNELAITVGILGDFTGNIISGMVFLAPLPTCYRIYRKKSTESFQSVPYVVTLFSSMLWLYYAFLKENEYFLITVNSAGCILETLYIIFFFAYASRKARISTAKLVFTLNLVAFAVIVIVVQVILANSSNRVQVLGCICAIVSTAVFAAPLAIMVKVIQTKSVEFMPFPLSFFLTLCAVIWFAYGLLRQDLFVSIPNIFGFVLGLLQMVLYAVCKYCCFSKGSQKSPANPTISKVTENVATTDNQQMNAKLPGRDQMRNQQDKGIEVGYVPRPYP